MTLEETIALLEVFIITPELNSKLELQVLNALYKLSKELLGPIDRYLQEKLGAIEDNHSKAQILFLRGLTANVEKTNAKAIEYLDQAISLGSIHSLTLRASLHIELKENEAATSLLDAAIEKGHAWAMYQKARLYEKAGDIGNAIRLYDKAIELGDSVAMVLRARLHLIANEREQAMALYDKAIELGNTNAMVNRARLHEKANEREQAIALYDKAIELGDTAAMVNRARLHKQTGEREQAIALYDKAIELNHTSAMVLRARLHEKANESEQAIALYDKAIKLGNTDAMVNRARLHKDVGESAQAINLYLLSMSKESGEMKLGGWRPIQAMADAPIANFLAKAVRYIVAFQGFECIPADEARAKSYLTHSAEFLAALCDLFIAQLSDVANKLPFEIVASTMDFAFNQTASKIQSQFKLCEINGWIALRNGEKEQAFDLLLSLPADYFTNASHLLHLLLTLYGEATDEAYKSKLREYTNYAVQYFSRHEDINRFHRMIINAAGAGIAREEETVEERKVRIMQASKVSMQHLALGNAKIIAALETVALYVKSYSERYAIDSMLAQLKIGITSFMVYNNHKVLLDEYPILKSAYEKQIFRESSAHLISAAETESSAGTGAGAGGAAMAQTAFATTVRGQVTGAAGATALRR